MATRAAAGVACLRLLVSGREAAREELEAVGVGGASTGEPGIVAV